MAIGNDFFIRSSNGHTKIRARLWRIEPNAAAGPPRGLVHVMHGLNGTVQRFDSLAQKLSDAGYVVFGQDVLGHGHSIEREEDRGYFAAEKGDDYVLSDLLMLHRQMKQAYPDLPVFVIAHSMGSFFARRMLISYPEEIDGAILMGTGGIKRSEYRIGRAYIKLVSFLHDELYRPGYLTKLGLIMMNHNFQYKSNPYAWVTTDEALLENPEARAAFQVRPTLKLYGNLNHTLGILAREENTLHMNKHCPIFIMYGELDPMSRQGRIPEQLASLYKQAGLEYVSLKVYPDARHELLSDVNKAQVEEDIQTWLEACIDLVQGNEMGEA